MQEGWECKKCHNVYSPNTPFCLYCWFSQNKENDNKILNQINTEVINEPKEEKTEELVQTKKNLFTKKEIHINKDLTIEKVEIEIPKLNKLPDQPRSDKWPDTQIYLSSIAHAKERAITRKFKIPYILDSIVDLPIQPSKLVRTYFDYIKSNDIKYMLDSGAFSYMNNPKKSLILSDHIKQYCYYINEFDINDFIELDLDVFMSLDEVENLRKKVYLETHKKPIIVWHPERGYDYWKNMCKENEFVAIGGLVTSNTSCTPERIKELCEMCDEAHMYGTRVHGLGFTPLTLLNSHTLFFDTVDSTTWNFTKRGNSAVLNEKGEIEKVPNTRLLSAMDSQEEDLRVWAKFSTDYRGASRSVGG